MASSSLQTSLVFIKVPNPSSRRRISINCGGPRSNRGPLVKGRILSIEAIHAIQALKRAERTLMNINSQASNILPRLIKSDLIATFKELLRQHHYHLSLHVFSFIRAEFSPELNLYADLVNGLSTQGLTQEIDELVLGLEKNGEIDCQDKGLIKLVKALVEAQRKESTLRVYGLMKKSGWGHDFQVDEYVAEVLSKGFRRMGEENLADEIDQVVITLFRTNFAKPVVV